MGAGLESLYRDCSLGWILILNGFEKVQNTKYLKMLVVLVDKTNEFQNISNSLDFETN